MLRIRRVSPSLSPPLSQVCYQALRFKVQQGQAKGARGSLTNKSSSLFAVRLSKWENWEKERERKKITRKTMADRDVSAAAGAEWQAGQAGGGVWGQATGIECSRSRIMKAKI